MMRTSLQRWMRASLPRYKSPICGTRNSTTRSCTKSPTLTGVRSRRLILGVKRLTSSRHLNRRHGLVAEFAMDLQHAVGFDVTHVQTGLRVAARMHIKNRVVVRAILGPAALAVEALARLNHISPKY